MSERKSQRRSFTDDYKREVAGLVIDAGRPVARVASELSIGEQTLGRWVRAEKDRRSLNGESTGALVEDERAELVRLRKEVFELR